MQADTQARGVSVQVVTQERHALPPLLDKAAALHVEAHNLKGML